MCHSRKSVFRVLGINNFAQDMQITLTFTRCHVSKMYSKTESRSNQKQKEGGERVAGQNLRYVVVQLPASLETSLQHYWIFFLIIKEFIVSQPLFRISLQKQPALKLLKTLGNFTFMLVLQLLPACFYYASLQEEHWTTKFCAIFVAAQPSLLQPSPKQSSPVLPVAGPQGYPILS